MVWDRSGLDKGIGIISEILMKEPDLSYYSFPEPNIDEVRKITEKLISNGKDTFKMGKIGLAYYERA